MSNKSTSYILRNSLACLDAESRRYAGRVPGGECRAHDPYRSIGGLIGADYTSREVKIIKISSLESAYRDVGKAFPAKIDERGAAGCLVNLHRPSSAANAIAASDTAFQCRTGHVFA